MKMINFGKSGAALIVIAIVLLSVPNAYSQSAEKECPVSRHSNYLQIGFINETALYYQCQISPKLDIRTGISGSWNYSESGDGTGSIQDISNTTKGLKVESKSSRNHQNFALSSLIMLRLTDYEYAAISLGAGPSVSYMFDKSSSSSNQFTDTTFNENSSEYKTKEFGIGPVVSVLIKSHIYESISLYSEYNFACYYTWYSVDDYSEYSYKNPGVSPYKSAYQTDKKSNGWKVNLSNIRIGLMIGL